MAMRAQTFPGTPATSVLWQPWIAPGQLLARIGGVPLGPDLRTHELVVIDPPMLQQMRIIHSMIINIFGEKDGGKTTLMRTLCVRLMRLQAGLHRGEPVPMRGRIHSRKPEGVETDGDTPDEDQVSEESEYKALSDCLHSEVFSPAKMGSVNLFDPRMNMRYADLLQEAINLCELMGETILSGIEPFVLQIGVWKMQQQFKAFAAPQLLQSVVMTLDPDTDVDAYFDATNGDMLKDFEDELLEDPDLAVQLKATMSRPRNINKQDFMDAAGKVAAYLSQVTHGVTGSIFRGTGSLYDIMSGDMTTIDWDGVDGKARSALSSMLWKWQELNPDLRPHINLNEEAGIWLRSLMEARYQFNYVKRARAYQTIDISSTQYRSDISNIGAPGSELRSLGEGILLGSGLQLFTRQPENDAVLNDLSQLGISDLDLEFMTNLPVGCFGIKAPKRSISFFQLALTKEDWKYNHGNQATASMINRQNVWDNQKFVERAERRGIKRIGVDA